MIGNSSNLFEPYNLGLVYYDREGKPFYNGYEYFTIEEIQLIEKLLNDLKILYRIGNEQNNIQNKQA